ncbi:MarR family winged helix-turn-helix transcriptional regulator [Oligoflexus tunisiensis]|uniref:MarR family winged helix-turn-helix transcriptional regulator n=1 Tax=Oligoflexus tunisiensis TaxID=708132 RepID=UPI00114D0552|nr:MarR family transcriptional regulator [Oligoflexus tunisiensis]
MAKGRTVSPLQSHIGFWMRLVSNNVSQAFARKLESTGVTVAEWVVMREMYGEAGLTTPSQVADLTGLSRGAVSKLLERLLQKGYIGRTESTIDRRYQDIRLTAEAQELVPRLAALADQNDDEYFTPLTEAERKQLTRILKKLARVHSLTSAPIE